MTIHVSATTGCNLGCTYCYENPDRERKQDWVNKQYDIEKIMEELKHWKEMYPNEMPGMHGGEPLLVQKEDLERIFSWIHENYDTEEEKSHIQTNATMMDEDHIEMFEKYNVHVGISCDGPPELNRLRKAAPERDDDSTSATDIATEQTHNAIEKVVESDATVGVITVLNTQNAGTDEKLEELLDWMDYLTRNGVSGHFNPAIPYEDVQNDVSLSPERLKEVYLRTWEWMKEEPYRTWGPMRDYVNNLLGNSLRNCVNQKCDVANAGAAKIVKGNGEKSGCGKTWSSYGDGSPFLQGESSDNEYNDDEERYDMLKQKPGPHTGGDAPDLGGCRGCKYWNVCQGGCPPAGMDYDYRNRTLWCEAKYALYEQVEHDLRALMPNITLITDFRWNDNLADHSSNWTLDIKPFAAMDPGEPGKSSATGGYEHEYGEPRQRIPEKARTERSWEEKKQYWRNKVGEDGEIFIDEENRMIKTGENAENAEHNDGWSKVHE